MSPGVWIKAQVSPMVDWGEAVKKRIFAPQFDIDSPHRRASDYAVKNLLMWIGDVFLILVAAFCTIGALTSAFFISAYEQELLPVFFGVTLALAAIARRWRLKGLLVCLPVLLIVSVFNLSEIAHSAACTLFFISDSFSYWIDVPVMFMEATATADELLVFWGALGLLIIYLLAFAVCLRRSALLTFLVTFPFILPTLIVVYHAASPLYLISLSAVYLILLLGRLLHPKDLAKRSLAAFPLLLLVTVLFVATSLIAPQDNYYRNDYVVSLDDKIRKALHLTPAHDPLGIGWPYINSEYRWHFNTRSVAVADAGDRVIHDIDLLEISVPKAGTYYLRGYSLHSFDGRNWRDDSDSMYQAIIIIRESDPSEVSSDPLQDDVLLTYVMQNRDFISERIPRGYYPLMILDARESLENPLAVIKSYRDYYTQIAPSLTTMSIQASGDKTDLRYYPYYSDYHASYQSKNEVGFYPVDNILSIAQNLPAGSLEARPAEYHAWIRDTFTEVDPELAGKLRELALRAGIDTSAAKAAKTGLDVNATRAVIADEVARYISSSARYTLTPSVFPDDADFVLYFLQTERKGYCIHFATAATLMLRALDVPARITFGFVVSVPQDKVAETIIVTDKDAHAWVEVYYNE